MFKSNCTTIKIQTGFLKEISLLYAALNFNGYNKENNREGMHPLRLWVRDCLKEKQLPYFDFSWHPYQYAKQVLTTDKLIPTSETNSDFLEAINYLKKFETGANFEKIWQRIKKETEKELKKYKIVTKEINDKLNNFFDFKTSVETICFSVNLLESYWKGFSIQLKDRAYVITGPSNTVNIRNALHEIVHLYLNEINFMNYRPKKEILEKIPENLIRNYNNKIIKESAVRAIVVYLSSHFKLNEKITLSEQDQQLIYPQCFFKILLKNKPNKLSKNDIQNLVTSCI